MNKTAGRGIAITVLGTVCLVFVVLISSMQLLCFTGTGWYEHEYDKYSVLENVRGEPLDMDGALEATKNLQAYLTGDEPELSDFFSEREVRHLADCKVLFKLAFTVRNVMLVVVLLCAFWLVWRRAFNLRAYWLTLAAIVAVVALLAVLGGGDFLSLFEKFHHIAFDNVLWLLDPRYDNLINLLPLGFFRDTVKVCVAGTAAVLVAVGLYGFGLNRRKN